MTNTLNTAKPKADKRRKDGQATVEKIVKAAFEHLQSGGSANFSMRNIAERAGVLLANLQYYFPKKEALILAVMEYVTELYDRRYASYLANFDDDPESVLRASIEFNLLDISDSQTRHFFIQYWQLLGVADDYSGRLLSEFYSPQKDRFSKLLQDYNPKLSAQEAQLRAEMISATFEGMMVTVSTDKTMVKELQALCTQKLMALAKS